MFEQLRRMWAIKELKNSILFVLGMLVIFRLTAHIPIPGVNPEGLQQFLQGNQILGLVNVFSGGTLENFSIVMLGVAPYITASIIFQLLVMIVPRLEELQKEGEAGQQKISMYTRWASIPLAFIQAFALIRLLTSTQSGIIDPLNGWKFGAAIIVAAAGTTFLMWLGELITETKIGNGVSLIIMAGIVSAIPTTIQTAIVNYNPSDLYTYILFIIIAIATIVAVVFISEGQRNIPVSYAGHLSSGRGYGAPQSHLPLRVNTTGVIPIIFAISVVTFPPTIAQFFLGASGMVGNIATWVVTVFQHQGVYSITYFVLVFAFTYFYTSVIFQPQKIAENLQRQGGFIPGIRPGKETEEYLANTMTRLVFVGALFLSVIAILPFILQFITGIQSLALGGTSLLIVVNVAIDITKKIEAQMTVHEYDHI